jgi:hypothetical protein
MKGSQCRVYSHSRLTRKMNYFEILVRDSSLISRSVSVRSRWFVRTLLCCLCLDCCLFIYETDRNYRNQLCMLFSECVIGQNIVHAFLSALNFMLLRHFSPQNEGNK